MKRLSYLLLPATYVAVAIGAFAMGVHHHDARQLAMIERPRLQPLHGNWFREAQSDGGIQTSSGTGRTVADDDLADVFQSDSPYGTFQNVYQLLKDQYVEGVPSDTPLAYGAAEAMLASLDEPNSRYIEPDERAAIEQQDKGTYPGSGIVFTVRKTMDGDLLTRNITVIDVIPGSPADKAGIKPGDVVTTVNGHWVIGYDPFQADEKIYKKLSHDEVSLDKAYTATEDRIKDGLTLAKAQTALDVPGTTLSLILDRPGTTKEISVSLDISVPTQVDSVTSKTLPDGKGYIRFETFDDRTVTQFDTALAAVASTPGIVVDLRDCPGGQIAPAIAIANSLAPGVEFGRIQVRDPHAKVTDADLGFGTHVQALKADASAPALSTAYHGTFIVLVDKATANTAEMFASFLHDHLGARIVGTSTFGDGLAQSLFPMSDGSAFTLTTGALETDTGKAFNMVGVAPDVPVADTAISVTNDVALAKADSLLSLPPLKVGAIASSGGPSISL